jgi:sulfotransferase family protein
MGSGTTLLRLMLDSHERIAIPHETGFMRAYNAMTFIPFKWSGREWYSRLGWRRQEFDEKLRDFFEDVFERYAESHGKQRWGEKTPLHTWHIDSMRKLFPESVFVAIARHPGAAIASSMRRFDRPLGSTVYHYERYAKEIARQAARHPRRMIVLRYEDLLLHTEPVMRELLEWLGEPWSDRVLEHHVIQAQREHDRIEGKTRADASRDPSRITHWAETMHAADQRFIAERMGRLGEFYGYSFDDPSALAPLGDGDSLLFGGPEVAARVDAFEDLELRVRMEVPYAERHLHPARLIVDEAPEEELPPEALEAVRRTARPVVSRLPAPARRALAFLGRGVGRLRARARGRARPVAG